MRKEIRETVKQLSPEWQKSVEAAIASSNLRDLPSLGKELDTIQLAINKLESNSDNLIEVEEKLKTVQKDPLVSTSPGYQRKIEQMFDQINSLKH